MTAIAAYTEPGWKSDIFFAGVFTMVYFIALLASYALCFGLLNDKARWISDFLVRLPIAPHHDGTSFFGRMFQCSYCTGFHTGWMTWLLVFHGTIPSRSLDSLVTELLVFALASAAFCYLVDCIAQRLER